MRRFAAVAFVVSSILVSGGLIAIVLLARTWARLEDTPEIRPAPAPVAAVKVDPGKPLKWEGPSPQFTEPTPLPSGAKARLGHFYNRAAILAFSADGKTVVTAAADSVIGRASFHLWDANSGKHLRTLFGHESGVICAAFSPDGKQLATGGMDKRLQFWDTQTGKLLDQSGLEFEGQVFALAFTRDNKHLVVAANGIHLLDAETRKVIKSGRQPDSDYCLKLLLAPNDKQMIILGTYGVYLWKLPDLVGTPMPAESENAKGGARALAFGAAGKDVLYFSHGEKSIWRWSGGGMKKQPLPSPQSVAEAFAFTPDGRRCVHVETTYDKGVKYTLVLSNTADLKEIRRMASPSPIWSLLVSPDGQTLAAGGEDASLRLWNLETGKLQRLLLDAPQLIANVRPNGKNVLTLTEDDVLHKWNLTTYREEGQAKLLLPAFYPLKKLSSDGKTLLATKRDGSLLVWDVHQGKQRWSLDKALAIWSPRPTKERADSLLDAKTPPEVRVEFSADDRLIIGRTKPTQVTLWDADTGNVRHQISNNTGVQAWALSPDGKTITIASTEIDDADNGQWWRFLMVIDVASGKEQRRIPVPSNDVIIPRSKIGRARWYGESLAISPDGKILAVVEKTVIPTGHRNSADTKRAIRLWDLAQCKEIGLIPAPATGVLAFSPDSKKLAFGSLDDKGLPVVRIWDLSSRAFETVGLDGDHVTPVAGLSFQADGKTLAGFVGPMGLESGAVLLWDLEAVFEK
jgi:WD40 repeat protein